MAHFAELDESSTVINVVVVHNDVTTIDGVEDEQRGIDFLNDLFPDSGTWVQTSYNSNFRSRYAGIGAVYDPDNDRFDPPRPFPSWTWTDDQWTPPTPHPGTPGEEPFFYWDEDTTSWVEES